jgi:hypothetical protein
MVDLEALDGLKVVGEVELGENDNLITGPDGSMSNHHQPVNVAEREQTHDNLGLDSIFLACHGLEGAVLKSVGNDVPVRDHDGFLRWVLVCRPDSGCHGGRYIPATQKSR